MQKAAEINGPMAFFSKCMAEGVKIKVVTRDAHHVKGYAVGTLVAHDKHWNLAMVDVTETFNRKRFPKTVNYSLENAIQVHS
jgi:hypothetical protein